MDTVNGKYLYVIYSDEKYLSIPSFAGEYIYQFQLQSQQNSRYLSKCPKGAFRVFSKFFLSAKMANISVSKYFTG